ncbi:hypothetical protein BDR26DRAFT_859835 [Obelidium mucronatum]|nr:hypothetical protein BDR26DRAFT_859835 [Obelidium mucronatum]
MDFDEMLLDGPVKVATKKQTAKKGTTAAAAPTAAAAARKSKTTEEASAKPIPKAVQTKPAKLSKQQKEKGDEETNQPPVALAAETDTAETHGKRQRAAPKAFWDLEKSANGKATLIPPPSLHQAHQHQAKRDEEDEPASKKPKISKKETGAVTVKEKKVVDKPKKETAAQKKARISESKKQEVSVEDSETSDDGHATEEKGRENAAKSEIRGSTKEMPKKQPAQRKKKSLSSADDEGDVGERAQDNGKGDSSAPELTITLSEDEEEEGEGSEEEEAKEIVANPKVAPKTKEQLPIATKKSVATASSASAPKMPIASLEVSSSTVPVLRRSRTVDEMNEAADSIPMKDGMKIINQMKADFDEYRAIRETRQEELLREYKEAASKQISALEKQVKNLETSLESSTVKLKQIAESEKKLIVQVKEDKQAIASLQKQLVGRSQDENLAEKGDALQKEIQDIKRVNSELTSQHQAVLIDLERVKKESDKWKRLAAEKEAIAAEADRAREEALVRARELEAELRAAVEQGSEGQEELAAALKRGDDFEKESKGLVSEVKSLRAKLVSIETRQVPQPNNRPAQPDRYTQTLERMVRMYEELTNFKIQSVEETRAEIDSDDEDEDEECEEEKQDEIDRARRRSVRRQSVGKCAVRQPTPHLEDVLEHRCEQSGSRGVLHFSLTMPKEQTATSSPNILYTLHTAKNEAGEVLDEDDEELPDYLNGEMTFPRDRLVDFFRKTCGWLFSA